MFSLWAVDPTYSNSAGTISFGGGSPSGYSGGAGTVLSVTFRAKTAGTGKVTFSNGSVLAADGRGTNVLTSMNSGSYTIAAAEVPAEPEIIEYVAPPDTPGAATITSTTHPNSDGWFLSNTAELEWTVPSDVTAVRTLLSDSAGSIPTKVYEPPISSLTINDLEEGVQYFHLQLRNADGWGRVAHYRLAVDTTDPIFDLELPEAADLSNPTQIFNFSASDTPSGIAKYTVQIDGGEVVDFIPQSATSSYVTPALLPGQHSMVVEAFDQAGIV
ncbi:MAG: hypothetical protein R3B69_00485 [Candidatus Paceibacterota bacterium]